MISFFVAVASKFYPFWKPEADVLVRVNKMAREYPEPSQNKYYLCLTSFRLKNPKKFHLEKQLLWSLVVLMKLCLQPEDASYL